MKQFIVKFLVIVVLSVSVVIGYLEIKDWVSRAEERVKKAKSSLQKTENKAREIIKRANNEAERIVEKAESILLQQKHFRETVVDFELTNKEQTSTSFFGVKLGETYAEVSKRLQVSRSHYRPIDGDDPSTFWNVKSYNPAVKEITMALYKNRIYQVDVQFSEISESNFTALKNTISTKYGNEIDLGLQGIAFGGEKAAFFPIVDGIEVAILIEYSSEIAKNQLHVVYVHRTLSKKVDLDKLEEKASKVRKDL